MSNTSYCSGNNTVTITDGEIIAQGGCNAPGIGGGNATGNITVEITGGKIDAKGGTRAGGTEVMPGIGSGTKTDNTIADKTGQKYDVATTGNITIGPNATLTDGTTVGAPAGNKYYECTEQPDGSKVYKTTDDPADTVALLISGDTVTPKSDLAEAIAAASEGDTVQLVANITLEHGLETKNEKGEVIKTDPSLTIDKAIILDLNGKTLTLAIKDDGLVGYFGCTIKNGNIVYTGPKNAIKAENIALIDHIDLKAENADVGVMIWGNGCHLDVISNSTIIGAKRGISTFKVNPDGNTVSAIGEMNKVTVDAKEYGVVINLSHCGKIVDSNITGGNRGISFQWHNDHAAYPPDKCEITGGSVTAKSGPAIEFWDDRGGDADKYDAPYYDVEVEINGTRLSGKEANTGALIYSLAKGHITFKATVNGTNAVCGCANFPWNDQRSESRWFDSFASAVANVNWSSRPLELLANVDETVTINKRVAVNLNGHTLNGLTLNQGGTVIADGQVGIVAPEGFVVVESVNDGTYTYTLRAVVPATGVTLDQTTVSLYTGNTATLTATVVPENADDKTVTWTSSDESVATVDANGVVTAVADGTATITATVGSVKAECVVTVSTYVPPYVPTTYYTLTVNYVYADGTTAAPSATRILAAGSSYSVESPAIEGYTPDLAVVAGTLNGNDTLTVTYTADAVPEHTVTVRPVDENGAPIGGDVAVTVPEGEEYTVAVPEIDGYTTEQTVVAGTMGTEDTVVTVTYTRNSDIDDENPPLVEDPDPEDPGEVDIGDGDTPLVDNPDEKDPGEEIPDEETPKTDVPQTGDFSKVWYAVLILSACGLVLLNLKRRKVAED